jgi:hypothetical protein
VRLLVLRFELFVRYLLRCDVSFSLLAFVRFLDLLGRWRAGSVVVLASVILKRSKKVTYESLSLSLGFGLCRTRGAGSS